FPTAPRKAGTAGLISRVVNFGRGRAMSGGGGRPGAVAIIASRRWTHVRCTGRTAMSQPSRPDFLRRSAAPVAALAAPRPAAVGALAAAPRVAAGEKPRPRSAADQVTLGRTGLKLSLLGMGTGSTGVKHSSNQVKLGEERFARLVRYAFDRGITYFDTADQYG